MFMISAFASLCFASKRAGTTFFTTRVARSPRMTTTTMSSARVKPRRRKEGEGFMTSDSGNLSDLEDRPDDRQHDEPDDDGEEHDQDRLDEGGELLGRDLDLLVVGGGDLVEHPLELPRLLADGDHVADEGGEGPRALEGGRDVGPLDDPLADLREDVREDAVVEDVRGDLQAARDRDAALEQRREGRREAGDRLLPEEVPDDREAEHPGVDQEAPLLRPVEGVHPPGEGGDREREEPPEVGEELRDEDEDLRRERQDLPRRRDHLRDLRDDEGH